MRRLWNSCPTALLALLTGASSAFAASAAVSAADLPKATPRLLRELEAGAPEVRVIIGMADGTPSARSLLAHPDPAGEPARRQQRLAAQKRLADEISQEELRPRHFYESFSMMAGTATPAGVALLASRPDVAWVTSDGMKKPLQATPQNAQLLINSDKTNSIGFTGAGQTIAVLDTGVDYTIPTLGNGAFPNAKVIGGTDTADKDSDPMDCEGHGTEVSGVIAGPTGVAPDAKIVAVKVFPSGASGSGSCNDAFDSDIIAGINFAITNKATFGITAINLSVGGSFDDGAAHGYCDTGEPAYATAIDSATAAGIVFVAAAGNDGTANALAVPACISSAVSVGAVYSETRVRVTWLPPSPCTDQPAVTDQIVCFSDSNTNLSLLAPGAFWSVAAKGGGTDSQFAGTSASSPAVAGAVALLKQARPDLTPGALIGVLRATGKPITDPRNGVTTPRIDTLASVEMVSADFAAYTGAPVPIPDGTGSATATTTTSGFTGTLASVRAWVEIDHHDPSQLKLTLIGPDGTSAVLQEGTGEAEHPINAIYGKTDTSAQSLGVFQGKQANGVWTLKVEDRVAGVTGRIRNFAVTLVPALPVESIPTPVSGLVLPVAAHVVGINNILFLSDLRVYNPGPSPRTFSLYYVGPGQNGSTAVKASETIGAGEVLALNDVISSEFGYADSLGQITIVSADASFLATSRAYTKGSNGTFGLFVPGFSSASGIAFGATATANGLSKTAQIHSNVGFTEVSGSPVSVRMDIRDGNGVLLGSTPGTTDAYTTFQITDIIRNLGLSNTSNFRVDFTVVSAAGRILPFATYVDEATGDGSFQPAIAPAPSSDDVVVSQTAHVTGANGDFFKTNLDITNLDSQPVTLTVSLLPLLLTGPLPAPRVYTLAPGQTLEKLDVLASEFGLADPAAGGLRIHPSGPARLAVSTRTYVEKFGGTFGFSVSGALSATAIGFGATATAIQLDQTSSPTGDRSNFGFTEVAGAPVTVRVTAKSGASGAILGSKSYPVGANSSFQANVTDILGAGATASNLYLQFTVDSGSGRVLPYADSIDNKSGDAIFMPAQ